MINTANLKRFDMRKNILRTFVAMVACAANFANAQPLSPNAAEVKQLEAMGYELRDTKDGGSTIASLGNSKIVISKNTERTVIFRMFEQGKKLNQSQEFELLKVINEVNLNNSYQVALSDGYLTVAIYSFGTYEPRTFAKLIRLIENANSLFDAYPKFLELLR